MNDIQDEIQKEIKEELKNNGKEKSPLGSSIAIVLIFTILMWNFVGIDIPKSKMHWGDMGIKMVEAGVIDKESFEKLYAENGGLSSEEQKLLFGQNNGNLVVTPQNSKMVLNMLWAFGLGNKNPVLENGPMMDPAYGGAGRFASTGGWTLAVGDPMNHYSKHNFVTLTPEQQILLEKVAKNIYRACCDNSTYFPDCNHGMAMLGLLELMASQGASEADMYKKALEVNTLWFPEQYKTIKTFLASQNIDWNTTDPKEILSMNYSSSTGFQKVLSQMKPQEQKSGTNCAV
ncbi:MAG: hypothetical protein WC089_03325 [Candidatus Paceibacterota bacterium]